MESLANMFRVYVIWLLIWFQVIEGSVHKGEWSFPVQADVSMLKDKVKESSEMACPTVSSETTASCYHENVCYSSDISTMAVEESPSNPVNCFVKQEVHLPKESEYSQEPADLVLGT